VIIYVIILQFEVKVVSYIDMYVEYYIHCHVAVY